MVSQQHTGGRRRASPGPPWRAAGGPGLAGTIGSGSAATAAKQQLPPRGSPPPPSTTTGLPIRTTLSRAPRPCRRSGLVSKTATAAATTTCTSNTVTGTGTKATAAAAAADNAWGYRPRPGSPPPSRDVLRFVHSLDLSQALAYPRRDLRNGYLVAEMLSRIYPGEVRMTTFNNGVGDTVRRDNWAQVLKVAKRKELALTQEMAEGVMQGTQGAALAVLGLLYETVTGKKVQQMPKDLPGGEGGGLTATMLSFGEPAGDSGALKAMKPGPGVGGAPTFGEPQTQRVGDAMALRRRYGAAG